ncbi:protein O-mannosyl-transferase family [Thermodesulfobacteriota bacterium]
MEQIRKIEKLSNLTRLNNAFPFILLFIVYLTTICPTVYPGDSGELTTAAFTLGISHPSGYPLYAIIGKIFCLIPVGNIGFRMNLMSSFFTVLAVWIVYFLILKITLSRVAAFSASILLAFTPLIWSQTYAAEVYPLHVFFVALLLFLLHRWDETKKYSHLILFAFIAGLSFCNHLQTLMLAPAVFFLILSGDKTSLLNVKKLSFLTLFFIAGLFIYIYLPVRTDAGAAMHWGDPDNLDRFFAHVSGESHRNVYVFNKSLHDYLLRIKELLFSVWNQFGIVLLMALLGWFRLASVRWKISFILVILFDSFYTVFLNTVSLEVTPFALPSCIVLTILAGMGIAHILTTIDYSQRISEPVKKVIKVACCVAPLISLFFNFNLCNQSRNYTAYEHTINILRTLDSGNTLFMNGDNNIFPVTYGRMVEGMREDVTLYDRYNLLFKMPYMDEDTLIYYGDWKELCEILEKKILERTLPQGVYYAELNRYSISLPNKYRLVPFGVLDKVLDEELYFNWNEVNDIWSYYVEESINDDFERDFMNRQLTALFHFNRGKHLILSGVIDAGLKRLKLASRTAYNDGTVHTHIAMFLSEHGLFDEAKLELEKAMVNNRDLALVYNSWGYFYYKFGDYDKAVEFIEKAIKMRPENYIYYNNLGYYLYEAGKKDSARIAFDKSLSIKADQPQIHNFMKDQGLKRRGRFSG